MLNNLITILLILAAFFMQGCATYSTPRDDLASKDLTPPKGHALIYIIRAPGDKGRLRAMPFIFNQEKIGDIWADQYLYVYAKPMTMTLPQANGRNYNLQIQANATYYLQYGVESSILDSILDPFTWEKAHFNVLSFVDGKRYINNYKLSGEFRRVTIGRGYASTIETKKPTNISFLSKPDSYSTTHNNHTNSSISNEYEYVYEDRTKKGSVTVTGSYNMRASAINKIKEICHVKNVALSTIGNNNTTSATFLTLSERLNQNKLNMQFECVY